MASVTAGRSVEETLMLRALELARRGSFSAHPNPRVGCVLAHGADVVGEGYHVRTGEAHAEVEALNAAGARARGATAYVTLEPCCHHGQTGPCTDALIAAGVTRVVCAMTDPDPRVAGGGISALRAAGIEVSCGLLSERARALNPGFISRMERGRPWLRAKLAMSLDARTALANGQSKWITGAPARADVQRYRAMSDAIITGVDTVIADDPSLTVRPEELPVALRELPRSPRQPLRIVMDSRLRTPVSAKLLDTPPVRIATASAPGTNPDLLARTSAISLPGPEGRPDPGAVLAHLAAEPVNEAWLEAGARLAGAFLIAGLVDELIVYCAPCLLGDDARALMALPPLQNMSERVRLDFVDVAQIGDDLRIIARPKEVPESNNALQHGLE